MANTAVVAGGATFVDLREDGGATDGHHAAVVKMFWNGVAENFFRAVHLHGRQEFRVRKMRESFGLTADAGKFFDVVVPGFNVFVANGPIHRDTVAIIGCKIQIAPAVALAAPDDGFSTDLATANPSKGFAGIRGEGIFKIADEKLAGVFVTGVIALTLDGLLAFAFGARVPAAKFEFPCGDVLDVIALWNDGPAGLEDQDS